VCVCVCVFVCVCVCVCVSLKVRSKRVWCKGARGRPRHVGVQLRQRVSAALEQREACLSGGMHPPKRQVRA